MAPLSDEQRALLCDPQTSGGLLIAVQPEHAAAESKCSQQRAFMHNDYGELVAARDDYRIEVRGMSRADTEGFLRLFLPDTPMMDTRAPLEFSKCAFPHTLNVPVNDGC